MKAGAIVDTLSSVLRWYFKNVYGRTEGPGVLPFYCDPSRVGNFAVAPRKLAAGDERTIFQLFVTLSMYQALRDVVIMRQQKTASRREVKTVADARSLQRSILVHQCDALRSAEAFDSMCDVLKVDGEVDCGRCAGLSCHVKDATVFFNRMGDMGKLPSAAWLAFGAPGGIRRSLEGVTQKSVTPTACAELLVDRFSEIPRVGRKLATLFVSELSVPALAPGLAPWYPLIDGNDLVVVDTNVARAVDILNSSARTKTYAARETWIRRQSLKLDLRRFNREVPSYSPRLVQQALYAFASKSNRVSRSDPCATRTTPCPSCAASVCPFYT